MQHVAHALETFIEGHFQKALQADVSANVRPILVGPPPTALKALYDRLTAAGTRDWTVTVSGIPQDVVVLYVRNEETISTGTGVALPLSKECRWDYAVTLRNSRPLVLMLVGATDWDTKHDSLQNTTEKVGLLAIDRAGRWLREPLWRHVVQSIATTSGLQTADVQESLRAITNASDVDSVTAERIPWEVADRLLAPPPPGLVAGDVLSLAAGLPCTGGSPLDVGIATNVVSRLGQFLGEEGIQEGINALKGSSTAQATGLSPHLDAFAAHLNQVIQSGANFARAAAWYSRPSSPPPQWWTALTVARFDGILEDLNVVPPPPDKIELSCTNAINPTGRPQGEPIIVRGQVDLQVTLSGGGMIPPPSYSRRQPRGTATPLAATAGDPFACIDVAPPAHGAAFKYEAAAVGYRADSIDVLDVESFECHGMASVPDAERIRIPVRRRGQTTWTQEVVLPRAGTIDLVVFHTLAAAQVQVTRSGHPLLLQPTSATSASVTILIDIEDGNELQVALVNATGAAIGSWTVHCTVDEPDESATNRFEALVRAHQADRRPGVARAPGTLIQRLESQFLFSTESWKPLLACWSAGEVTNPIPDWTLPKPRLGNVNPATDPRPNITPPASYIATREAVRIWLRQHERPIAELDLTNPEFASLVEAYVGEYVQWLEADPDSATWPDCVAMYAAEWREEANAYIASTEPVAALLSPLHPLRLGWHVLAQTELAASQASNDRCPAAGLLDPNSCPDGGALALAHGGSHPISRAFFAVECDNPHWPILLSKTYLDREADWNDVRQCLAALGLEVKGITGGITRSQAADSLQQVSSLEPARAVMRVALVGSKEGSQGSTDGVMQWCEDQFADDAPAAVGPNTVDVYDLRDASHPSQESLADLSKKTSERVRWYRPQSSNATPKLDLSILDQLGTRSPSAETALTRSPISQKALCRIRIREDFQNGQWLRESRMGTESNSETGLSGRLRRGLTLFEGRVALDTASHVRFQPLQQAIGLRLERSIFVAISSSQIDPACIVRGTMGQGGYLWNYELPGALGGAENRVGYYLIANPVPAMRQAITRSASLITATPPDPQLLLEEISRRGIPIMKRLVSGGGASRGELGMLLAVRLLQDVFRTTGVAAQLPVQHGRCVHLIIPVDPYSRPFDKIRKKLFGASLSGQRGDFIVIAIRLPATDGTVELKITPVEVKFRDMAMGNDAVKSALDQAANLGSVLERLWVSPPRTDLWATCRAALLAQCLDFAFRIYAHEDVHGMTAGDWTGLHQRVLQDVIAGRALVTVTAAGRAVVFDRSMASATRDMDGDGRHDTAILCRSDAEALLIGGQALSAAAQTAARVLDFSFPTCGAASTVGIIPAAGSATPVPATMPTASGEDSSDNATPPGGTSPTSDETQVNATHHDIPQDEVQAEPASGSTDDRVAEASTGSRPATSPIPPEIRQQVRGAFDGFIGNEPAVRRLTNDLLRALIEQPPHLSKNYLLTGQPSTGKTELARRMARALALPFVRLDGRGVQSRERLFELVNGEIQQQGLTASQVGQMVGLPVMEYPPLTVFIDEVHLVPRAVQESLLTMLEAADRTVTLNNQVARVNKTTFLFATTRASDVDTAFRTRCTEVQLREYTQDEVAVIVQRRYEHDWPDQVYLDIAKLGRCVPRVAIELARELETAITVAEHIRSPEEYLDEVREARELDELGLNPIDAQYLDILERENRPVGEQAVLNMLGSVDRERIVDEVEPFLKRLGFIRMGPRGREITTEGKQYVLNRRRNG